MNAFPDDVVSLFQFKLLQSYGRCSNKDCASRKTDEERRSDENDHCILMLHCINGKQDFNSLMDFQKPRHARCECGAGNFEEMYTFNFTPSMKFLILRLDKMNALREKMKDRSITGFLPLKVQLRFQNSSANGQMEVLKFKRKFHMRCITLRFFGEI